MLATSKNVFFPGHNHLLTTSADDPLLAGTQAIIKGSSALLLWSLWPGNRLFLEVASKVVSWWIVAFSRSERIAGTDTFILKPIAMTPSVMQELLCFAPHLSHIMFMYRIGNW